MKKMIVMALAALVATGCATKGELAAVQTRVDGLSAEVATLKVSVNDAAEASDRATAKFVELIDRYDALSVKIDHLFYRHNTK